ncbi:hypothetical protein DYI26_00480 [Halomonas litopenaei]|nr:hypothetical protein [Halomonas litopenaei]
MKLKIMATSRAPDYYTFDSDKVTAHIQNEKETFDLTDYPEGAIFTGSDLVYGIKALRNIERVNGELVVTLTQKVIAGQYPGRKAHWRESPIIDAADYDPNTCYVIPTGMQGVDDYEIVQGVDVAGNTGWTVRKKETADG